MSVNDRMKICKILNRTNYRILAWYFGFKETEHCGLRNFKLLYSMPMQSTGGEKFTVYVYYRTKAVSEEDLRDQTSDEESGCESQT
mmetsp:Transcript_42087/g.30858  ORF Transcript_42087/g.30858 Transcript_42087/m.30858 type:complete len:86 (+) Transcript_42087:482-739(+)